MRHIAPRCINLHHIGSSLLESTRAERTGKDLERKENPETHRANFKTAAFNRSATSPFLAGYLRAKLSYPRPRDWVRGPAKSTT